MSDTVTHYMITGNVTDEMSGNTTDYMITGNVTGEMSGNITDTGAEERHPSDTLMYSILGCAIILLVIGSIREIRLLRKHSTSLTTGCMQCRLDLRVETFHDLRPGDHICMPGRVPIFGGLYDHHAIVSSVEDISADGKTATLIVFDVDQKGKERTLCPGNQKPYSIKEHCLYDMETHKLKSTKCMSGGTLSLNKIVYRQRKFNLQETERRARLVHEHNTTGYTYCLCILNCEHFASACVNGRDDIREALPSSLSKQASDLFVMCFSSFLGLVILGVYYGTWIYTYFVVFDNCNSNNQDSADLFGFVNIFLGYMIVFIMLRFVCLAASYHIKMYVKKRICKQYLIAVCIDASLSYSFALFTVWIILHMLMMQVCSFGINRSELYWIVVTLTVGGTILAQSLASIVTKAFIWSLGLCCQSMKGLHEFIPFKGIVPYLCKLRCCRRNAKRKLADDIELATGLMNP